MKRHPRTTAAVMLITGTGMALSLLFRAILIPMRFGFTATADALVTALTVVLAVETLVREGAKFSLVPRILSNREALPPRAYRQWTQSLLTVLLSIAALAVLVIECFAPWIAGGLLGTDVPEAVQQTTTLLRLCAPLLLFGCGSTVLGAFLNSERRFKTVALRNVLPAGSAAGVLLLFPRTAALEQTVAVAYTLGFLLYFGWVCIGTYRAGALRPLKDTVSLPTLGFALRTLKETVSLPTLGFALRQIVGRVWVEVYLLSHLGAGSITQYKAAFQMFSAGQTLIGISLATTGLPDMAMHAGSDDKTALGQTLRRKARAAICISTPVTLGVLAFHADISRWVYGSGTLDPVSLDVSGQLLFWLSTGLIFACLIPVLNAGLYAQNAYRAVFANMVTMAVLNVGLTYGLIGTWGLLAVPVSVSLTAAVAVGNLTYLLRRRGVSWG